MTQPAAPEPDRGNPTRPDMGEPLTQPNPAPVAAPQPAPPTQQPPQPTPPTQQQGQQPNLTIINYPPATATSTAQLGDVTVPQLVAPVPPAGTQPAATDPGFPANTPWRDMTPDQQVAYWQHQARRHEDRVKAMGDYDDLKKVADQYQALVQASQTDQERAVAEARRQGQAEALAAAGSQLVEQWMRAAAVGRLGEDSVNAILSGLDRARFLAQDGTVDTAKVYGFVNSIAPAAVTPPPTAQPGQPAPVASAQPTAPATPVVTPAGGPDFGQGQPGTSRPSGLALGAEIARQRFAQTNK